jgi:Clostripain family
VPTITLTDQDGKDLLSSNLPSNGLGKYFKAAVALKSVLPIAHVLSKPLADHAGARELSLVLDKDVPIGSASELSISGGASVRIGLHEAGSEIFAGTDLQAPVKVPNGTAFTSVTVEATLKAGLATTRGSLGFGFEAGTALRYAYFHPFDVAAGGGTVGEAIKTMLAAAVFPADADDLARVPVGAVVSVAGEGELSFSGQASLSSTTNLLATPGLPIVGAVSLVQAGRVSVAAAWTASGAFELRVSKPDQTRLHLAFHRRRGRSLTVSATGSVGISAELKGKDLLAALMQAISPDPKADLLALVDGGLDDATIEAIQKAIAASIDRSLTLSAQLQASTLGEHDALFAFDVNTATLDDATNAAIAEAVHGRLSPIEQVAATDHSPVRLVTSAARELRERKTSWRINMLGIVNVASFRDLVRDGSVFFDPVSGALTAAEKVSAKRIRVKDMPLASDPDKLRKVLFESLMVTAAYQASRAVGGTVTLTADQIYLEQRSPTKRRDFADHYQALIALGLCDEHERDRRLGTDADFGSSTFVIQNHFDAAACDTLFLDGAGKPHPQEFYERIARQAFLALNPATDPERSYRRAALDAESTWARVRNLGGEIAEALPAHIRNDGVRLAIVRGDAFTIVWWAAAMSRAGRELIAMRAFLGPRNAAALNADPAFVKARRKLSDALGDVVATTEARFDDPWDILAMDAAAARLGSLESVIISTRFAAQYKDGEAPPAIAAPASRGIREAAIAPAARAARDWTPEELTTFSRHVVNLRKGKLSTSGSFSSTPEQVRRVFAEFIPAYAAVQQAAGRVPRVLFFAHGGLTEEREGLLAVLARRRFWDLNNVYPVYFVWETGLLETLKDLLGTIFPMRATRGPVTDLAIEKLARPGGKAIWGEMKASARAASDKDGGARLVAELAAKLWKDQKGTLEFHALGHSAGAIFHAFFLPVLVAQKPAGVAAIDVRSVHLLAPAATTALFKDALKPLVGSGKPIARLTEYTMADDLEQHDPSLRPYGKSLLYLVSNAFDDDVATPLLGMQAFLKQDLTLIRFFGLAGTEKVADIVFSKTADTSPLNARTRSATHGGFDNDIPTMTSVIRRTLDVPDSTGVTDYFEDPIPGFERPGVGMPSRSAPAALAAARAPAVVRSAARRKPWTVMVWMAGDNDLEAFGEKDLAELKRVGTTDAVNVIVQFDSMSDNRTRRYEVKTGGDAAADVVQELGETNTGDPLVAIDFFSWAIDRYPADRLLGVLWNHGSGIDDTDVYARSGLAQRVLASRHRRALFASTVRQAAQDRAIAFDDTSRDFLDNVELKKVLATVKKDTGRQFDVLGFDACLMNMIEVAYQLQGTSQILVGSEEVEPLQGWPYDRVLEAIAANPAMSGAELGRRIVDFYVESYSDDSVTQSAFALDSLETAATRIDALAKALTKAIKDAAEYAAVAKTLNAAQRFDNPDFVDLGHFCGELAARSKSAAVKAAARATAEALTASGGFVLAEGHKGAGVGHATGAAIYFPRGPVNKAYAKLDFAKANAWRTFLDAYHKA